MANALEQIENLPVWQRALAGAAGTVVIVIAWYFFFYADALAAHENAERALNKAETELARVEKERENFLERQRKHAESERELARMMEVLPMNASTVDNLMQIFQQQARLVGLTVESWSPETEQRENYWARLPVRVRAVGSWAQFGEFLRRVSECNYEEEVRCPIVSIGDLTLTSKGSEGLGANESPQLDIAFQAATYRFLTEAERKSAGSGNKGKRRRKRKK